MNTNSEMKGSVTFPYDKINSRHQNDEITKVAPLLANKCYRRRIYSALVIVWPQ